MQQVVHRKLVHIQDYEGSVKGLVGAGRGRTEWGHVCEIGEMREDREIVA